MLKSYLSPFLSAAAVVAVAAAAAAAVSLLQHLASEGKFAVMCESELEKTLQQHILSERSSAGMSLLSLLLSLLLSPLLKRRHLQLLLLLLSFLLAWLAAAVSFRWWCC